MKMAQQFDLKFDKDGLIPAIVVDSISKKGADPYIHERAEP